MIQSTVTILRRCTFNCFLPLFLILLFGAKMKSNRTINDSLTKKKLEKTTPNLLDAQVCIKAIEVGSKGISQLEEVNPIQAY